MYEGFSGQARKAIELAHREARRLNHDYVGTEHLLLGVFREGSEGVAALLRGAGLDAEKAYREVESHLPRDTDGVTWDKLPLTPGAKRALQHARQEASNLHHPCVGPEHLLLGALHEPDSTAAQILLPLGLAAEGLRDELAKLPEPENRDWMLRPPPTPGLPAFADPSVRDLQAVVTEEVLPTSGREEVLPAPEGIAAGAVDVKRQILRLDNARLDLLVVESQLQFLQFLVACIAGVLLGAHVRGFRGAVIGLLAGYVVAAIRNSYLGAVAGMIAGGWYGWLCSGEPGLGILGTLVGIFLGSCLGDWRKLRAPPGSG